jgi:RNA polymerase sigma factor (TIGR02999 family)
MNSPDPVSPSLDGLILSADGGDKAAIAQLFATLYRELHRLAERQLRINAPALTVSATTLLHEAYMGLARGDAHFPDRARFFAYASRAMRGLIVDAVRERRALKRGGLFHLTTLVTAIAEEVPQSDDMDRLNDALDELKRMDAPLGELVDLKYFCGLTFGEIATLRQVSERTVQRDWTKARLFLHHVLKES